jgi:uncharacterized repeat protein (TIGR04052 family)
VPFALNHSDAATAKAPLNSPAMAWSWQVGRKFTKIELTDPGAPAAATWPAPAFYVHLGSTGCTGNPATGETVRCAKANRPKVTLARFDAARQQVAVDVRAMLAGNDVTVNGGGAPGCMSGPTDPECAGVFNAFGLAFDPPASGENTEMPMPGMTMPMTSLATAAHADHAPTQTVFRAIKR